MATHFNLYEQLVRAGAVLDHHESDLYVECEPGADAIVRASGWSATRFVNEVTGKLNWDLPFAYYPWWAQRVGTCAHVPTMSRKEAFLARIQCRGRSILACVMAYPTLWTQEVSLAVHRARTMAELRKAIEPAQGTIEEVR
jgi:hypothetical protein